MILQAHGAVFILNPYKSVFVTVHATYYLPTPWKGYVLLISNKIFHLSLFFVSTSTVAGVFRRDKLHTYAVTFFFNTVSFSFPFPFLFFFPLVIISFPKYSHLYSSTFLSRYIDLRLSSIRIFLRPSTSRDLNIPISHHVSLPTHRSPITLSLHQTPHRQPPPPRLTIPPLPYPRSENL